MRKSRYVVMNQDGGWQIRNASRHVTSIFPSKAQALSAAIELAEKDGEHGHAPEVLVRHEDDRYYRVGVRRRRTGDRVYPEQRRVRAHGIEVRFPIAENGGGTGH